MKTGDKKQLPKSEILGKASEGAAGENSVNIAANIENDLFNKHYNKELRVSKDEIPIVLAELNESAVSFIKKD